jgi:hypothetical protein
MNKKMATYCYSTNNEDFSFDDEHDAIGDILNDDITISIGDEVTIWQGETTQNKASYYLPKCIAILINELAFNEHGEVIDEWLTESEQDMSNLQTHMENAINEWCDKNNRQPAFYSVDNIKKISFKITKINDVEFEYEEIK